MDESKTIHRLTHPQQRIWYSEKLHGETPMNTIGGCLEIQGDVDVTILTQAIDRIIESYDVFNLRFLEIDGEPFQQLHEREAHIEFLDFSAAQKPELELERWAGRTFQEEFQLMAGNPAYFAVYKIGAMKWGVLVKLHHIIADGWSLYKIIQRQIIDHYTDLSKGIASPVAPHTYLDYIGSEEAYFQSPKLARNKVYWLARYDDLDKLYKWGESDNLSGSRTIYPLDQVLSMKVNETLERTGSTLNELFISVLMIYFAKRYKTDDFVIGLPIFNRRGKKEKECIGMYTSTLPFRITMDPALSFDMFLKDVKKQLKSDYRNQRYPYDQLLKDLKIQEKGLENLFGVSFNYYNSENLTHSLDWTTSMQEYCSDAKPYPLHILLKEWGAKGQFSLEMDYRFSHFTQRDIEIMYASIEAILHQVLQDETVTLAEVVLESKERRLEKLHEMNNIVVDYPRTQLIHQLFEAQAAKTPEACALRWGAQRMTYGELNARANGFAHELRERGVSANEVIGILSEHSFELVIAILASLKLGAAYLPIDPDTPEERIRYILEDSKASLLLVGQDEPGHWDRTIKTIHINEALKAAPRGTSIPLTDKVDLAYMIYTSGSTGKPKGVMVGHQSLINYIWWCAKVYVDGPEVFPLYSSIASDLTVTSVFTPLITGNTIAIYPDNEDTFVLERIVKDNISTIVKLTPSHLRLMLDYEIEDSSIKKFIVGGENLKTDLCLKIEEKFKYNITIFNEYGPTEATVGCMLYTYDSSVDQGHSVSIGTAIMNTQIYVLDEVHRIVPDGVEGELYIGGDCLAKGYMGREDLTCERFIPNPFVEGGRMYKTGDTAIYLPGQNIEYIGRNDNQVKIRGYRIEINEIEGAIVAHEAVDEAVVVIETVNDADKIITAYFVPLQNIEERQLKEWLKYYLPNYMIPNRLIPIEIIPLTSNGKVDVTTLKTYGPAILNDKASPESENERLLVGAIQAVMNKGVEDLNQNFYHLGGDSIKAMQIASRLRTNGYTLKPKDLLGAHTLKEIAEAMDVASQEEEVKQGYIKGVIYGSPITSWYFAQAFPNAHHYNQSILLRLDETVEKGHIEEVMARLVEHHDTLRLNIRQGSKELFYNEAHIGRRFDIQTIDLRNESSDKQKEMIETWGYELKSNFVLEKDLLIKGGLFHLGTDRYLLLTAHHALVDGVSWRIILEDLAMGIQSMIRGDAIAMPPKTLSFSGFNETFKEAHAIPHEERKYWEYADAISSQGMMSDQNVQASSPAIEKIQTTIKGSAIESMQAKGEQAYGLKLDESLVMALALAIHKTFCKAGFVIEQEHHGRHSAVKYVDVSRTVGWFTSLYPTVINIPEGPLASQIREIKDQIRAVPANKSGYGALKYLHNALGKTTHKHIRFNYMGDFDDSMDAMVFQYASFETGPDICFKNPMTSLMDIDIYRVNGEMIITFKYCENHLGSANATMLSKNFVEGIKLLETQFEQQESMVFSASDFDAADLSIEELDTLFA